MYCRWWGKRKWPMHVSISDKWRIVQQTHTEKKILYRGGRKRRDEWPTKFVAYFATIAVVGVKWTLARGLRGAKRYTVHAWTTLTITFVCFAEHGEIISRIARRVEKKRKIWIIERFALYIAQLHSVFTVQHFRDTHSVSVQPNKKEWIHPVSHTIFSPYKLQYEWGELWCGESSISLFFSTSHRD